MFFIDRPLDGYDRTPSGIRTPGRLAEATENTRRGARGLILPASTQIGNSGENTLLPQTAVELKRLGISPQEVALDGGFHTELTTTALEDRAPTTVFIAGRQQPGSKRTQRRLRRYRTGAEGRISHLKTPLRNRPIPPQRQRRPADLD